MIIMMIFIMIMIWVSILILMIIMIDIAFVVPVYVCVYGKFASVDYKPTFRLAHVVIRWPSIYLHNFC